MRLCWGHKDTQDMALVLTIPQQKSELSGHLCLPSSFVPKWKGLEARFLIQKSHVL